MSNDNTTTDTTTPVRRLRVAHLIVQPVLVWDDGTELTKGPDLNPAQVSIREAARFLDTLPAEVEALAARLAEQEAADPRP